VPCRIFYLIKAGEYEPYTSPYATREINNEPNAEKREKMKALVSEYGVVLLPITEEITACRSLCPEKGNFPGMGNRRGPYCNSNI
jgi:hypothetical protein